VYAKIRKWGQHVLLATCDAELLGRILREGKIVFEIHEQFYKGPRMTIEEVINLMQQSTIVNMVGNKIVSKAIERGLVHPDAVLEISGVPHAQIVKM
jgi:hypothetical protein